MYCDSRCDQAGRCCFPACGCLRTAVDPRFEYGEFLGFGSQLIFGRHPVIITTRDKLPETAISTFARYDLGTRLAPFDSSSEVFQHKATIRFLCVMTAVAVLAENRQDLAIEVGSLCPHDI